MKGENERRIVAEKQGAEIDNKIVQCKSNISVANDLFDLAQVNIKQAVEEINTQKRNKVSANFRWGQKESENLRKINKNCKRRKVIVLQRKVNDRSF